MSIFQSSIFSLFAYIQQSLVQNTSMLSSSVRFCFSNKINYFKLFNLPHSFTDQQLKSSYLQLVKKYHPDLSDQPNAKDLFRQIQQGYEILSDENSRKQHAKQQLQVPVEKEQKDIYDEMVDKFYKRYERKDLVNDEFNFSYRLFKEHYEKVQKPKGQYQRFEGQGGDQYFAHKQEKGEQWWKQLAAGSAAIGVIGLAYVVTRN